METRQLVVSAVREQFLSAPTIHQRRSEDFGSLHESRNIGARFLHRCRDIIVFGHHLRGMAKSHEIDGVGCKEMHNFCTATILQKKLQGILGANKQLIPCIDIIF
jgi:hypothetical protein